MQGKGLQPQFEFCQLSRIECFISYKKWVQRQKVSIKSPLSLTPCVNFTLKQENQGYKQLTNHRDDNQYTGTKLHSPSTAHLGHSDCVHIFCQRGGTCSSAPKPS